MMTDWQPIETAPKDGTKILVYSSEWAGIGYMMLTVWHYGKFVGTRGEGTHWQPLPLPPVEVQNGD